MMRREILCKEGCIVVTTCDAFACWDREIARPGLIAAGYFACRSGNSFINQIIADIHNELLAVNDMARPSYCSFCVINLIADSSSCNADSVPGLLRVPRSSEVSRSSPLRDAAPAGLPRGT